MEDSGSQQFSRGDRISDRFEIEKHIGSGMLGVTYLAKDTKNATPVALKFVKPKLVAHEKDRGRFEQAFARSAAVQGEGLIPFGEIGEHDGQLYYSQEYFPSQNLRQLIDDYQRQQKSFSLQESCQIVLKVLEAVQQLHDAGIIHGNLKPENILVQSRQAGPGGSKVVRTIKVDDAGLAAVVNPTIFADSYISRDEARYLAPELSSFDEDGAFPSDVYSVGVIFYELLVGQTPRGTYLSPTQLRGDLAHHIDDIVELAISESAEDRYRTAVDMLNDIQRSFSGEFIDDRRSQTFRNVLIGLFAAVVTVLVVGGYLVSGEPDDGYNEAVAQDNQIRSVVKAQNPLPTQEEWEAKLLPGMIYVPGGSFVMGRLNQEHADMAAQSEPLAAVKELKPFYIDRFEFPNRRHDAAGKPQRPVGRASWKAADDACQQVGKRLCTEAEWEKACKGPDSSIYAWGDTYDPQVCGEWVGDDSSTADVVEGRHDPFASYSIDAPSREGCVSGYGTSDLSGGFREWTSTVSGAKGARRVVKGGLRANAERGTRCAFAVDESEDYADGFLTFRCCMDESGAEAFRAIVAEEAAAAAKGAEAEVVEGDAAE